MTKKTLATLTLTIVAALAGFGSSATAQRYLSLDTNPSTATPSSITGAIDQSGSDWVRANAVVGNSFNRGFARTDITGMFGGGNGFSRYDTSVTCSDGKSYNIGGARTVFGPTIGVTARCPTTNITAVASLQMISWN